MDISKSFLIGVLFANLRGFKFEMVWGHRSRDLCRQMQATSTNYQLSGGTGLFFTTAWLESFQLVHLFVDELPAKLVARPCLLLLKKPLLKHVWTHTVTYLSRTLRTPMHQWSFKNNCSLFSVKMIPDIAVTFIWTFISFMKVRQVIGKGDSPITMYNRKSGASAFRYHPILLACWRGI